jgi:hypothetical protein
MTTVRAPAISFYASLKVYPADVFLSPLQDFKDEMTKAGLDPNVVYLDRGEAYSFTVRE